MQEVLAADWPDLSGAEEAGQRRTELFGHQRRIVIRHAKHASAPPVAGEQQGSCRLTLPEVSAQRGERRFGSSSADDASPHVELHGLSHLDAVAHGNCSGASSETSRSSFRMFRQQATAFLPDHLPGRRLVFV